jgi:EmrB/QacA subfamily drug resistance transporter
VHAAPKPAAVLATCCLSLFLVTMDSTIVNVALPAIGRGLDASVSGLSWSIDGYTVVLASFLVLGGSIADRFGRRRVFQIGLAVFGTGSLLCSLAPTIELLVACRVLQAIGGAMLNPVAMSIIVNVFTDPKQRAAAIGVWGSVHGVSMAIGPLIGGALVEAVGWRAIFWVNVPIGLLAIALTRRFVPESRADRPRRLDPVGQTLIVVGLAALTSSLIEGRGFGWRSAPIAGGFAAAAIALVALVAYERRRREPLVDPRFFRSLPFSAATVVAVISFATFNGGLFLGSLYLQEARGLAPREAGLCLVPIAAALVLCSPLSGRLVGAGATRRALVLAGAALAAGALLLVGLEAETPLAQVIAAFVLLGAGIGFANAPITSSAVSGMPRAQAGVAAALAATSRQVGATLGVALAGTIAGAASGNPQFADASRPYWWLGVGGGVAIVMLGIAATGAHAHRSALAVRSLLDTDSP